MEQLALNGKNRSAVMHQLRISIEKLNETSKRLLLEAFGPRVLDFVKELCCWGIGVCSDAQLTNMMKKMRIEKIQDARLSHRDALIHSLSNYFFSVKSSLEKRIQSNVHYSPGLQTAKQGTPCLDCGQALLCVVYRCSLDCGNTFHYPICVGGMLRNCILCKPCMLAGLLSELCPSLFSNVPSSFVPQTLHPFKSQINLPKQTYGRQALVGHDSIPGPSVHNPIQSAETRALMTKITDLERKVTDLKRRNSAISLNFAKAKKAVLENAKKVTTATVEEVIKTTQRKIEEAKKNFDLELTEAFSPSANSESAQSPPLFLEDNTGTELQSELPDRIPSNINEVKLVQELRETVNESVTNLESNLSDMLECEFIPHEFHPNFFVATVGTAEWKEYVGVFESSQLSYANSVVEERKRQILLNQRKARNYGKNGASSVPLPSLFSMATADSVIL